MITVHREFRADEPPINVLAARCHFIENLYSQSKHGR